MSAATELDDLLAQARDADPSSRISLRDPIAAFGEPAIKAMTDWLGDLRLAAFAIRVLERIGSEPANRSSVVDVLLAVDRTGWPDYLIGDLDRALMSLNAPVRPARRRAPTVGPARDRPVGTQGLAPREGAAVGGRRWTEGEYERLFGRFPVDGPRPAVDEFADYAQEAGRTTSAISWQWDDGAAYVAGRSASTTSLVLKAWLDRTADTRRARPEG